jgi:hypothetical protein
LVDALEDEKGEENGESGREEEMVLQNSLVMAASAFMPI